MEIDLTTFSNKLRKLRLERDILQKNIASELFISLNYYSEIERGERSPSLYLVLSIKSYYSIPIDYLFAKGTENSKSSINSYLGIDANLYVMDSNNVNELYERIIQSKDKLIDILIAEKRKN